MESPFNKIIWERMQELEKEGKVGFYVEIREGENNTILFNTTASGNLSSGDLCIIIDAIHQHIKANPPEGNKQAFNNAIDALNHHMVELKKTLTLMKYTGKIHQQPGSEEKLYPPPPEDQEET